MALRGDQIAIENDFNVAVLRVLISSRPSVLTTVVPFLIAHERRADISLEIQMHITPSLNDEQISSLVIEIKRRFGSLRAHPNNENNPGGLDDGEQ
jgi:hypothetical protein